MADLQEVFTQALRDLYARTRSEVRYNAMGMLQMVNERGGVEAARRMVNSPNLTSEGLTRLYMAGRLDLSVEALMLQPQFAPLFSAAELAQARAILLANGNYKAPWDQPDGVAVAATPVPNIQGASLIDRLADAMGQRETPQEDPTEIAADDNGDGADEPPLNLADWQARYRPENPLGRRIIADFPTWLAAIDPQIELRPRVRARLGIFRGHKIMQVEFPQRADVYARILRPTAEDLDLLRQLLSDPASLQANDWLEASRTGLQPHRFFVRTEDDYDLLKEITRLQAQRAEGVSTDGGIATIMPPDQPDNGEDWPGEIGGPVFVVTHKHDDECQRYGESYCFSSGAGGSDRQLADAVEAFQQVGTPVYLLLYRPGPDYAFTGWARVRAVETFSSGQQGGPREGHWRLLLDQHEFPAPLDLKGSAVGLMSRISWLQKGLKAAFWGLSIRPISAAEFKIILDTARGATDGAGMPALADAAYAVLLDAEGGPLSASEIVDEIRAHEWLDPHDRTPQLSLAGTLLRDSRFTDLGANQWALAGFVPPPLPDPTGVAYWRVHFPRGEWPQASSAGIVAIDWPLDSTNQSVQRFKRVKAGDRIVVYVQGGMIGGVGIVKRGYYDLRLEEGGTESAFDVKWPQRVDVAWDDELPEPLDLLTALQAQPALYNKMKNPNTVMPLTREDYEGLLKLVKVNDDGDYTSLPAAWAKLTDYYDFAVGLGEFSGGAADLLLRAREFGRDYPAALDGPALVDALRQLRLLESAGADSYKLRPFVAGARPAVLRLMALALLTPREASPDTFFLPLLDHDNTPGIARRLTDAGDKPAAPTAFAPELGPDGPRLLGWYSEAGLVRISDDGWQPAPGALDPLAGDDPASAMLRSFLAVLHNMLAGTVPGDLEPVAGPLPRVADFEARLNELDRRLLFDHDLVRRIYRSLLSGRHVVLSGPPGTGKTELAKELPTLIWTEPPQDFSSLPSDLASPPVIAESKRRYGYKAVVVTATEEWSVRDVVGGIAPRLKEDGKDTRLDYAIQHGHVTRVVLAHYENTGDGQRLPPVPHTWTRREYKDAAGTRYRGAWLVIDEFTRAPVDAAFGSLLTALGNPTDARLEVPTGDFNPVSIPLPADFRIIGTLNSFDRHFLNQMSEALKRRFDFIDVSPPAFASWPFEHGIAAGQALDRVAGNRLITLEVAGEPPSRHWAGKLTVRATIVGDGSIRYLLEPEDASRAALDSFRLIFSAIRVFRQLGTAQVVAVYTNLFTGVAIDMPWVNALDTALADSLADQLQILSREEQRILLALLDQRGQQNDFGERALQIIKNMPRGRQYSLLRDLSEAARARHSGRSIDPDQPDALTADDLNTLFVSHQSLSLPDQSSFRQRLYELTNEQGL